MYLSIFFERLVDFKLPLSAYLREAGEIEGHNPNFSKHDRSQFLQMLNRIIQGMKATR